jgi:hypothetical protein
MLIVCQTNLSPYSDSGLVLPIGTCFWSSSPEILEIFRSHFGKGFCFCLFLGRFWLFSFLVVLFVHSTLSKLLSSWNFPLTATKHLNQPHPRSNCPPCLPKFTSPTLTKDLPTQPLPLKRYRKNEVVRY